MTAVPNKEHCYHAIAIRKLVLRKGSSLDSTKLGNIRAGTKLTVLEQSWIDNNLRAKVGMDSTPRGVCVSAMGWVTAEKEGETKLQIVKGGAGIPKAATRMALRLRNLSEDTKVMDPSFMRLDRSGSDSSRFDGDSMASRIARRRQNRRGPERIDEEEENDGDGSQQGSAPRADAKAMLLSSQDLTAIMDTLLVEAGANEAATFDTAGSRIGQLLRDKNVKLDYLMVEWDRNHDGVISKQEHRLNLRKLGLSDADVSTQDLDLLYDSFDLDGSGSLDLDEMKGALQKFKSDVTSVSDKTAWMRTVAASKRRVADAYRQAAGAMAEYEVIRDEHEILKEGTIGYRLGAIIKHRQIKVGEVVTEWDKNADGGIDRAEFFEQARLLGLQATDEQLEQFFSELDSSDDGHISIPEVVGAFKKLTAEVFAFERELAGKLKIVNKAKKKAQEAQLVADKMRMDADAELEAQQIAAREAEAAKAAAIAKRRAEELAAKREAARKLQERTRSAPEFMRNTS